MKNNYNDDQNNDQNSNDDNQKNSKNNNSQDNNKDCNNYNNYYYYNNNWEKNKDKNNCITIKTKLKMRVNKIKTTKMIIRIIIRMAKIKVKRIRR